MSVKSMFTVGGLLVFLIGLSSIIATAEENKTVGLQPQNLKCEYLTEPLGLDVPLPRLSWNYSFSDDKQYDWRQTAYRIIVAENKDDLQKNVNLVWDSNWVNSECSTQIVYAGKPLHSDCTYYWQVSIRDNSGHISISNPTFWSTGLFSKTDWTAKWIGNGKEYVFDGDGMKRAFEPWFRRSFQLENKPNRAMLHVATFGYHEVYVNGKKIGDQVLVPNVCNYTKRALYLTYDIAPYLKKGDNVIAFWLGTGWSIYTPYATKDRPSAPLVRAQVTIRDKGNNVCLATDSNWKTEESDTKLIGRWFPGTFCGEFQDGGRSIPDWNKVGFDDSSWKPAVEFSIDRELSAPRCESSCLAKPIKPIAIEALPDNKWKIDMGVNFAGWTEIDVQGKPGEVIEFGFSELKETERTFDLYSRYRIGPSGKGTFRNRFNYSSGRWITVKGFSEKPTLDQFRGWNVRTAFRKVSEFECSDKNQNWVNHAVLWTFENLTIGGYIVDCSSRERMGYGGDAHATMGTGLYNYDLAAFYSKWMRDWRDVQGWRGDYGKEDTTCLYPGQKEDVGQYFLPNTAPTCWGGGGPAWGSIVLALPWSFYQQYGDKRILEENFEMMERWLIFLDAYTTDGLMRRYSPYYDYGFLGDWLWPDATGNPNSGDPDVLCFNNMFRVYNLQLAVKIARVLGKNDKAEQWEQKIVKSRNILQEKYFKEEENTYFNGWMSIQSLALLAEVPPVERVDAMMKRLEKEILVVNKGHIGSGITGGAILFQFLRNQHRDDLIYSMTSQEDCPGWLYMRNKGDTIWEAWKRTYDWHTCLHSSYLYPSAWYIDSVLGIRSDEDAPGFRKIVIHPPKYDATPITWANGSFDAPTGKISVQWQKGENNGKKIFVMTVAIPPNTTATVYVPSQGNHSNRSKRKNAVWLKDIDGFSIFKMNSGTCQFEGSINK